MNLPEIRPLLLRLLSAGVFLMCAAVVFWMALVHTVHLGTVSVPDLSGMSSEDAETLVHDLGLILEMDPSGVFSTAVEAGRVADQDPPAGFHLKTGSAVSARLSLGGETVRIPDLGGESLATAQRELEQLGLHAGSDAARVHGQADGEYVIASDPSLGLAVPPAAEVRLLLNATPQRKLWVTPSMVSYSVASIRRFCRDNNLRLGHIHQVEYPGLQSGVVLRQYPQAGSPLSRSDIITIWVSQ